MNKTEKNKWVVELPLMESFYTIQGEGVHSGTAAYFIRLGGCDVGCHWCDVKESWDAKKHPLTEVSEMVKNAKLHSNLAVITGGEPLMYNLDCLTQELQKVNIKTHIETSGAYALTGFWNWICLSPKKVKLPLNEVYAAADELKIIVYNKDDLKFAEQEAQKVSSKCILLLQPEWSKNETITPLVVDYIKTHPQWKLSLQTHKYIDVP